MDTVIIGAGFTGLIAAHAFPRAVLFDAAEGSAQLHHALLRFRSDAVANLTGIEFRKVEVRKNIWDNGASRVASIKLANLYSKKVTGEIASRSIWDLKPVTRYIAPENFYDQLMDVVRGRIQWGTEIVDLRLFREQLLGEEVRVINTAPLPTMLKSVGIPVPNDVQFKRSAITVGRWRVPNCDVHQTIYFPDPELGVYRASITGSMLIVESVDGNGISGQELDYVSAAFGGLGALWRLSEVTQNYGKIKPIPDSRRKSLLYQLTRDHDVFSIGRFATWRNILLDDVVHDIAIIKQLMHANPYEQQRQALTGEMK